MRLYTAALLAILVVFNIAQCFSLVHRVEKGTDFTVFYNTGRLLDAGAGAEIYRGTDQTTAWLRTIPPFGQLLIHPFGQGSARAAAMGWSVFNLALLALMAWTLSYIARHLEGKRRLFYKLWPWNVAIMLALSPASLQVGQWSVLFAACWVFYLGMRASRWKNWAGAALALPIAVKIYPLLILGVPLLARRPRVWLGALVFVVILSAAPTLLYGARTAELSRSFWRNAIAASSGGRVAEAQRASSPANQGLDSVALRFLTTDQPIQRSHPNLPHLALPVSSVLRAVNWARIAVMLISLWIGWHFWRGAQSSPLWGEMMLLALGCAALYVILPGAKTRYAIYAFPAFWPLLCCAVAARTKWRRVGWIGAILVCLALVGFTPGGALRLYGAGWWGALGLWSCNGMLLWRWRRANCDAVGVKLAHKVSQ